MTHDYKRHGTTTLFAALDVLTGQVLAQCKPRHRHQEFLGFLRAIEAAVPTDLDVHLIVDNYSNHRSSVGRPIGSKSKKPRKKSRRAGFSSVIDSEKTSSR